MPEPTPSAVKEEPGTGTPEPTGGKPAPVPATEPKAGEPTPGAEPKPDANKNEDGTPKMIPISAMHDERDKRQSLQAELDALRQVAGNNVLFDMNGNPVQQVAPTPQAAPAQADEFAKNLDKAWENDPREAVEMTVGAALQWRDDIDAAVEGQIQTASGKYEDFNNYQHDVRKYIRALPMNQRGNAGVADMAYFVVKGQKSGNVYTQAQADMLEKIKKGEAVTGLNPGTSSTPAVEKGIVLTQDQLNVAAAMGLSPEDYKSAMKQ